MFISEIKEKNVVGLAVDVLSYSVRLISDKSRENTEMSHPSDNVIPIGFPQVQVCFFSEEKNGLHFPASKHFYKFSKQVFNNNLPINKRCVTKINNEDSTSSNLCETIFECYSVSRIISEEARVDQCIISGKQSIFYMVIALPISYGFAEFVQAQLCVFFKKSPYASKFLS